MAVSFRAWAQGTQVTSTVTVPLPTGTVQGDVMVAHLAVVRSTTITPPSGWTLIRTDNTGSSDSDIRLSSYWKAAGATEPSSYDFTLSAAVEAKGAISSWDGVDNTAPVDVSGGQINLATTSCTAPSITTTESGCRLIGLFSAAGAGTTEAVTPPAGMTERYDFATSFAHAALADESQVVAGATGSRTATLTSSVRSAAQLVALAPENFAPNGPTGLSPSGTTINRANTNRFSWNFSDPDAGDSQSQYDLRYRLTASATWTVVTETTPNQFRDFVGGTFPAGDYEWQVRTYDARGLVGPYSSSAFFTATDAPAGPSITDPVAGQTISTETYTVVWSIPSQEAYQVRTVADAAGSPDPTTVYTDTGEVTSSSARSRSVAFATNGRAEHIQVRVKDAGLWSSWISVNVTVSYTGPATPTVAVDVITVAGAVLVQAAHPTPSGSEPTVVSVDIYRRVTSEGGDGIRVAAGLVPTGLFIDWAVASGVDYGYRVRAHADNGTSSWSAWSETATELDVIYGGGYA